MNSDVRQLVAQEQQAFIEAIFSQNTAGNPQPRLACLDRKHSNNPMRGSTQLIR